MSLSPSSSLFFDASALILAANNAFSGSAFLLAVCGRHFLQAMTSPDALAEAERNLLAKFPPEAFTRLQALMPTSGFIFVSPPSPAAVEQYEPTFFEDAHIVAATLAAKADYLLSVDKPLIKRIIDHDLPIIVLSPKEFLETVFPTHPDYVAIHHSLPLA